MSGNTGDAETPKDDASTTTSRNTILDQEPEPSLPTPRQIILFIQECGFILEARELTVATACVLLHKYILSSSKIPSVLPLRKNQGIAPADGDTDNHMVAISCLLLAGKIEENHLNIRKLINVAYKTFFRDKELTDIDEYYAMRTSILTIELWLLRLVGFYPVNIHPHQFLVCFLKACEDWLPRDLFRHHPVAAVSWSLLRDIHVSEMIVKEKPEHLSVAVVACALQLLKISVPADDLGRRSWIKACCHDLSSDHLDRLTAEIVALYR